MKKILMTLAAVLCCFTSVNAQTTETESNSERYLRLSKEADENPTDWKAQMEVVYILTDKNSGFYNQQRATRYLERIYHTETDHNKVVPDSVLRVSLISLITLYFGEKDFDKTLFYIDEMKHAKKVGVEKISNEDIICQDGLGLIIHMMKNNALQALSNIMEMRQLVTENKMPGIEYSNVMTAMLFDNLFGQYQKMFGDKLLEVTIDGKKYIIIAMKKWNIEKPLMGWMGEMNDDNDDEDDETTLAYGEDGKVYDELDGHIDYGFKFDKNGLVPQEGYNTSLITVTPEQRQQMVEAYHKYLKKEKKNKK
ncbi:MAG: hypothetical protein IKO73_02090 [Bacteroidaceae bacterium]|nr:hypothetical protein [Bacteroidaceae bacterium]MBR6844589.1 hypothetical protein [Bacteroidales bacterium]